MLELVNDLMTSRKPRRHRALLARLRTRLRESHAARLRGVRSARTTRPMRALLEQSLQRTAHWRLPRDPRSVYRAGVQRIYALGRLELQTALARGSPAALHEWGKQAKYLGTALSLVAGERTKAAKAASPPRGEAAQAAEARRQAGAPPVQAVPGPLCRPAVALSA
jgi:hypothetical protein